MMVGIATSWSRRTTCGAAGTTSTLPRPPTSNAHNDRRARLDLHRGQHRHALDDLWHVGAEHDLRVTEPVLIKLGVDVITASENLLDDRVHVLLGEHDTGSIEVAYNGPEGALVVQALLVEAHLLDLVRVRLVRGVYFTEQHARSRRVRRLGPLLYGGSI
jgi:hypothetical protein